jgi:hypothetical protein
LTRLKIAVFAPIPRASVNTAIAVNIGAARNDRRLCRTSFQKFIIRCLFRTSPNHWDRIAIALRTVGSRENFE